MFNSLKYAAILICAILVSVFAQAILYSQSQIISGGRSYVQENGVWYHTVYGKKQRVNDQEVTVRIKPGISIADVSRLNETLGLTEIRRNILGYIDLKVTNPASLFQIVDTYRQSGLADDVEINTFGDPCSTPNDPYFTHQWQLNNTGQGIDATEAWSLVSGSGVTVAVIDDGFDDTLSDIGKGADGYQNVYLNSGEDAWSNEYDPSTGNHIDNDGNGLIDDWKGWNYYDGTNNVNCSGGHGTLCANILGLKTNNNLGCAGVAGGWGSQGVRIVGVKIGTTFDYNSGVIDDAILYAVSMGVKVINMSWCFLDGITPIADALTYARSHGVTLVAAAGNSDGDPLYVQFPASDTNVIGVAGIKKNGSWYTRYTQNYSRLCVAAPAESIYTENVYGAPQYIASGTSFSTPLVAGVVALMLSANPSLTPDQIRSALQTTADDIGPTGFDSCFGYGRVNAYHAVLQAYLYITPTNYSPSSGTTMTSDSTLHWNSVSGASNYQVQIASDSLFANVVRDSSNIGNTSYTLANFTTPATYWWRVRAKFLSAPTSWSTAWKFLLSYPPASSLTGTEDCKMSKAGPVTPLSPCGYHIPYLSWTTSNWSNVYYHLFRYFCNDGCTDTIGNCIYSGSDTHYRDTVVRIGSDSNHLAYYYVKATALGISSFSNKVRYDVFYLDDGKTGHRFPPTSDNGKSQVPTEYRVCQNYPDPFNPTTVIRYELPKDGYVSLKVYNVLGTEVSTLVDAYQVAGSKTVSFDGSNLPSGIYYYRLQSKNYVGTKKMILLK